MFLLKILLANSDIFRPKRNLIYIKNEGRFGMESYRLSPSTDQTAWTKALAMQNVFREQVDIKAHALRSALNKMSLFQRNFNECMS